MDILDYRAADYFALADFLDAKATAIEQVMPPVLSAVNSTTFEGRFAKRAKQDLQRSRRDAHDGAVAVRRAAAVVRARAADLQAEQAREIARRAAEALRRAEEKARELLGGD